MSENLSAFLLICLRRQRCSVGSRTVVMKAGMCFHRAFVTKWTSQPVCLSSGIYGCHSGQETKQCASLSIPEDSRRSLPAGDTAGLLLQRCDAVVALLLYFVFYCFPQDRNLAIIMFMTRLLLFEMQSNLHADICSIIIFYFPFSVAVNCYCTRCSNYEAANMIVRAKRFSLVQ